MKYARFSGRARRREYWLFVLLVFVAVAIAASVDVTLGLGGGWYDYDRPWMFGRIFPVHVMWAGPFTWLTSLLLLVPSLAVTVRRLHDSDRSGAWVLVTLVPALGGLVMLILMLIDGTDGPNDYGRDPKQRRLDRY